MAGVRRRVVVPAWARPEPDETDPPPLDDAAKQRIVDDLEELPPVPPPETPDERAARHWPTILEVEQQIGVTAATIRRWCASGKVRAVTIDRAYRVCPEDVIAMQQTVKTVYCSKEVRAYIAAICAATRNTPLLSLGASTRAAIALIHAAQANAMLCGRDYIIPEDVQHLAPSVLCHRLSLSAEARMRGYTNEQAFAEVLSAVRIPVRLK